MSGTIGYTDFNGNTAAQVIASLRSAAAADGQGWNQVQQQNATVYFEDNGDVRSTTRDGEWPATESQLTARGVPWLYEDNTSGATPQNRSNVLGAVCGSPNPVLPNGSTYLPGSWADNLTSYGCDFADTSQTKATLFISSGAAGTTGAVVEPYAVADRFTNSSIYTFIADGSTLGEAFAKSVASPDMQMPWATCWRSPLPPFPRRPSSGPSNYGAAAGTISFSGSAVLLNSNTATGDRHQNAGTACGRAGQFFRHAGRRQRDVQPQHGGPFRRRPRGPHRRDQQLPGRVGGLCLANDHGGQPRPLDQFQRREPHPDLLRGDDWSERRRGRRHAFRRSN